MQQWLPMHPPSHLRPRGTFSVFTKGKQKLQGPFHVNEQRFSLYNDTSIIKHPLSPIQNNGCAHAVIIHPLTPYITLNLMILRYPYVFCSYPLEVIVFAFIDHQFHRYGITFRAIFPCLFGCNFIFYPQNHKNKILLNGILPDHYTLRISKELAYGKYFFLVLKVALRNHINFDAYFEPLSNNYKTLCY